MSISPRVSTTGSTSPYSFAIIEGPRCVGKSLLCGILRSHGVPVLKFEKSEVGDDAIYGMHKILEDIDKSPEHINNPPVLDRFHITEFVLRTGQSTYSIPRTYLSKEIIAIHRKVLAYGGKVYMLWSERSVLDRRHREVGREPDLPPESEIPLWYAGMLLGDDIVLRYSGTLNGLKVVAHEILADLGHVELEST